MDVMLPILLEPRCPVPDDPGILRFLELVAACSASPWVTLEVSAGHGPGRQYRFGSANGGGVRLPLACRPPFAAALHLAAPLQPVELVGLASLLLDQLLRARLLAEQAMLLRGVLDTALIAILLFDPRGNILHANPPADQLLSRQTEDGLRVVASNGTDRPLVELLCHLVEALVASGDTELRTTLALSDGSTLAGTVTHLAPCHGVSAVLVRLQSLEGAAEQALEAFAADHGLSPRESEVTALLHEGLTTAEIGQRLAISPHTVRDHLKNLFRKTDTSSRSELVGLLARLRTP